MTGKVPDFENFFCTAIDPVLGTGFKIPENTPETMAPEVSIASSQAVDWHCTHTWRRSARNTLWCLAGCSIGDFGTIAYFQFSGIPWPTLAIMILAIINGLLTSIALETVILFRGGMDLRGAFHTAVGMSMVSMLAMEIAMNTVDWTLTGGAVLNVWVVPLMLAAGFVTPWPYNYWRLKKWGKACH